MKCRVVLMFDHGVRRPRDELRADPGTIGNLVVVDREARHNSEGRTMRSAELLELDPPSGWPAAGRLVPLFDVKLLRVTARGMLLRGFQVYAEGGTIAAMVQEWWCEFDPPV